MLKADTGRLASGVLRGESPFTALAKQDYRLQPDLRQQLGSNAMFVISIDEAEELPATTLDAVRAIWSPSERDGSWNWPMTAGLFLVLAGTTKQLTAIAPLPSQSGSGRIASGTLMPPDPFTAFGVQQRKIQPSLRLGNLVKEFRHLERFVWSSIPEDDYSG